MFLRTHEDDIHEDNGKNTASLSTSSSQFSIVGSCFMICIFCASTLFNTVVTMRKQFIFSFYYFMYMLVGIQKHQY
jgi:hypothetical protein